MPLPEIDFPIRGLYFAGWTVDLHVRLVAQFRVHLRMQSSVGSAESTLPTMTQMS